MHIETIANVATTTVNKFDINMPHTIIIHTNVATED